MFNERKYWRKTAWILGGLLLLGAVRFYFSDPSFVVPDVYADAFSVQTVVTHPKLSVTHPNLSESTSLDKSKLGLPMRSEELISAVRSRLLKPSNVSTPYSLSRPEKTFFAQFGQDKLVAELFNNKREGFFLEAGALDGEYLSNTLFLERQLDWTGILVEPNPNTFEKLKNKNRKAYLLNAGFSLDDTSTRLDIDLGGLYPELSALKMSKASGRSTKVAPEDCFPLFTVLAAVGHPLVDLMVLDVEGVEFKVLQSVPWEEVRVRLLLVETNHVPEGFHNLKSLIERHGFKEYRKIEVDVLYYRPDYFQPNSETNQTMNRKT